MNVPRIEPAGEGEFKVGGDLVFETVGNLLPAGEALFRGHASVVVDLSGVQASDSAGIALLLEWLAGARGRGERLAFRNLPDPLRRIARLSNLEPLLPGAD